MRTALAPLLALLALSACDGGADDVENDIRGLRASVDALSDRIEDLEREKASAEDALSQRVGLLEAQLTAVLEALPADDQGRPMPAGARLLWELDCNNPGREPDQSFEDAGGLDDYFAPDLPRNIALGLWVTCKDDETTCTTELLDPGEGELRARCWRDREHSRHFDWVGVYAL